MFTIAGSGEGGITGLGGPATAAGVPSRGALAVTPDGGFVVRAGQRVRRVWPDGPGERSALPLLGIEGCEAVSSATVGASRIPGARTYSCANERNPFLKHPREYVYPPDRHPLILLDPRR